MSSERLAVSAADLDDVDLDALDQFLEARVPAALLGGPREPRPATNAPSASAPLQPRDEIAVRLGLLARISPRLVPTLSGLYLFGKLPQLYFPEWGVVCTASRHLGILDPIERRADLDGNLGALVEQAVRFVGVSDAPVDEAEAEQAEYDADAVREAIVNALVHRDLRKPSRVAIRVFVDRLEIWSPGGPPEGVTELDELARGGGVSHPRNPVLASVARSLGIGEQLGRGLLRIGHQHDGAREHRAEIRPSTKDVLVVLPSRWNRPRAPAGLS